MQPSLTFSRRVKMSARAGRVACSQIAMTALFVVMVEGFLCIRVVTLPVEITKAFLQPEGWKPPWSLL